MRNLFSDNNSGYRLKTLQILNWGVFDKKVVTFSFDGKSTILTGLNGSGKTTTVDAILTLLVPPNKRFYNLSSENNRKRERDEKNYVLGAYGFKLDEESSKAAQYLRNKNEVISILNGIFYEPNDSKYLSLLQVRYFSGEDLRCLKIITEKELRIEEITQLLDKNNTKISQSSKWVQFLTKAYGSKSYERFVEYQNYFMERFGFRSDNALKLFSQTVGLKVLGDITSFIRGYMLEDKSPIEEYEEINSVFSNLMIIERNMRKTEKQIEFLSKTVELGERFTVVQAELNSIKESLEGLECWFILHVLTLGEEEIRKRELEIDDITNEIEKNKVEIEKLNSLFISLQSNASISALKELEHSIKEAETNVKQKRDKRNNYESSLSALKSLNLDMDFEGGLRTIEEKKDFILNQEMLPKLATLVKKNTEKLNAKIIEIGAESINIQTEISNVENEIQSLEERENNIPSSLVMLREKIASRTGVKISSLPFLGELVRVKDSEKEWEKAIENLLTPYSLMLVTEISDYNKIANYLDKNNLSEKIGIIKKEDIIKHRLSSEIVKKIEIKKGLISSWLNDYLENEIPHSFVSTEKELLNSDYAVLPSGIIKTEEKIIKDDRLDSITGGFPRFLGWTNRERLEELYKFKADLNFKLDILIKEKYSLKNRNDILQKGADLIEKLFEFTLFDEIDRETALKLLNERNREKQEFLKFHNLEEIQAKIEEITRKKRILSQENENLLRKSGAQSNQLDSIKKEVERYKNKEDLRHRHEDIVAFEASYAKDLCFSSLDSLRTLYGELQCKLNVEREEKEKLINTVSQKLLESMNKFLFPSRNAIDSDIDWAGEYSTLNADINYFEDFKALYIKLKEDSIIELREKFSEYLEDSLSKVVGTLSEELANWDKDIKKAISILNKNLMCIPFNKEIKSYLRVEAKSSGNKDFQIFSESLRKAIPDKFALAKSDEQERRNFYLQIKKFLDKYNNDEKLKKRVLDLRNKYNFIIYEDNKDGNQHTYSDTGALSGGEKAKLTFTILAAALCYQYNLDNEDEKRKGPFRFVILDEAFSKSDAFNSQYALELFKELDLQLMVVTPRNGINLVESYISSLHLIEKRGNTNTSTVSSMTIEEYRRAE